MSQSKIRKESNLGEIGRAVELDTCKSLGVGCQHAGNTRAIGLQRKHCENTFANGYFHSHLKDSHSERNSAKLQKKKIGEIWQNDLHLKCLAFSRQIQTVKKNKYPNPLQKRDQTAGNIFE